MTAPSAQGPPGPAEPATPPRTAGEMLARARPFLERKGVPSARLEAELLCAHALGLRRLDLFLSLDRPLTPEEVTRARELLVRRAGGEPTAYLVGEREFYGRPFAVGPAVLVPRPETELLVDVARERAGASARVLDVGTGSGCVAVTLALELEDPEVHAVDVSAQALEVARANAEALGARVRWLEGDGIDAVLAAGAGPFDLVVSNPPYVDPDDAGALDPSVRDFEPATALFSPPGDPDHWTRRLVAAARELLAPGGVLLVELGAGRGEPSRALAAAAGLHARLHPDLAGIPRVLEVAVEALAAAEPGA